MKLSYGSQGSLNFRVHRWARTERWEGKGRLKTSHHFYRASLRLLMTSMAWKLTNSLPIFRIRQTATLKGTGMLISLYLRSTPSLLPADEVVAIMFRYHTLKGLYLRQGRLGVIEREGTVRGKYAKFAAMQCSHHHRLAVGWTCRDRRMPYLYHH